MNWYEIALGVVLVVVSLLIIVFTLAQEQKGQGLSGAIMGESSAMAVHRPPRFLHCLLQSRPVCGQKPPFASKTRPAKHSRVSDFIVPP